MGAISKEQFLALTYGVLIQNLGATTSRTFTGINPQLLIAPGVDSITSGSITAATTTIPVSSTLNMKVGDSVERLSGTVTMAGVRTIQSIVENTSITVSGNQLGGTFPGTITIAVGGINLTSNQIPGTGDPARQALPLATSTSTITTDPNVGTVFVARNGGDLDKDGNLEALERDYHLTGQGLRKKLK